MKYETHCDRDIPSEGLVHLGEICCEYDILVKFFGQPLEGNGITSLTAEWHILFQVGSKQHVAHIYDAYNIKKGEKQFWNITGTSKDSYRFIRELLNEYIETEEEEFEDDDDGRED